MQEIRPFSVSHQTLLTYRDKKTVLNTLNETKETKSKKAKKKKKIPSTTIYETFRLIIFVSIINQPKRAI